MLKTIRFLLAGALLSGLFTPPAHSCNMGEKALCRKSAPVEAAAMPCHRKAEPQKAPACPEMICCLAGDMARASVTPIPAGRPDSGDYAPAVLAETPLLSEAPSENRIDLSADPPASSSLKHSGPASPRGPPFLA